MSDRYRLTHARRIDRRRRSFARRLNEYWYIITLVLSVLASGFYMVVFQVTPLDQYVEIRDRKAQVRFHDAAGYALLERGHYPEAREEFARAAALSQTDLEALNGQYMCDLFLGFESSSWDPAVALGVQDRLHALGVIRERKLDHVMEKYLGDLNRAIGNAAEARRHYERALADQPAYVDALFSLGWLCYAELPDAPRMDACFRAMVRADSNDYRGYHGAGYALYMDAVRATDAASRAARMAEAARLASRASALLVRQLNIVMDFGEIARSSSPDVAVAYHRYAMRIIDDSSLFSRPENQRPLSYRLLLREGTVLQSTPDEKRAIVGYQLALDWLSLQRQALARGDQATAAQYLAEHDRVLREAQARDASGVIRYVYDDQRAVLDRLLAP